MVMNSLTFLKFICHHVSILQVWTDYKSSCENLASPYLSYQRFYGMWKEEFPHVKIPKYQKLSKCNECVIFKETISKKLTKIDLGELKDKRRAHLLLHKICREKYYKHIKKSKEHPSMYTSVIIDNMDQSKTNLPRFPLHFKNESTLEKMHHHVTGVLCHALKKAYTFTWTDQFSSDCNITLNCLMSVLGDVAAVNTESFNRESSPEPSAPPMEDPTPPIARRTRSHRMKTPLTEETYM
ncbi:Hypothetical predicted protein [Mytilus galloprovincialis]|uniref:DUF7869 domain-containing protein n=1 Tax=Mytilus galloprovincialis TaxID=29158 RepID=A0A8B6DVX9_MYTGA|nr:Hypothetical predicted protein [Mytilus galloprovincialis]